jgi:hypothetical protein
MRTRSCARSVNKELLRLDDDSLAAVLAAVAEHYNQLSELASTCRRLCTLVRHGKRQTTTCLQLHGLCIGYSLGMLAQSL